MAELADALDLGSSEATRTGSIPARCTSATKNALKGHLFFVDWLNYLLAIRPKSPPKK